MVNVDAKAQKTAGAFCGSEPNPQNVKKQMKLFSFYLTWFTPPLKLRRDPGIVVRATLLNKGKRLPWTACVARLWVAPGTRAHTLTALHTVDRQSHGHQKEQAIINLNIWLAWVAPTHRPLCVILQSVMAMRQSAAIGAVTTNVSSATNSWAGSTC